MEKICLRCGQSDIMIVSKQDLDLVLNYKWYLHKTGKKKYVRGYTGKRSSGLIYLHHLILKPSNALEVDHIDGNGLNNTRENLRLVSRSQNNHNRKDVKGYYFETSTNKWRSEINLNGKKYVIGRFELESDARKAYLKKKSELPISPQQRGTIE